MALVCLGVHARHVARIRVAVGIAVLDIKKQHEVVAVDRPVLFGRN